MQESGLLSAFSLRDAAQDGGYGWIVVLASFSIHLLLDGCESSFGIIFEEWLTYFKASKMSTAWVGSLFSSLPLLLGPIAGALINKFGCRVTGVIGGILTSIGLMASAYMNSLEGLCVTFGIISGLGVAFSSMAATIVVNFYFNKKRAFAYGLAVSGSGIGTIIFSPFIDYLQRNYGWKKSIFIIGLIMALSAPCALTFRPIDLNKSTIDSSTQAIKVGEKKSTTKKEKKRASIARKNAEIVETIVSAEDETAGLNKHEKVKMAADSKKDLADKESGNVIPNLTDNARENTCTPKQSSVKSGACSFYQLFYKRSVDDNSIAESHIGASAARNYGATSTRETKNCGRSSGSLLLASGSEKMKQFKDYLTTTLDLSIIANKPFLYFFASNSVFYFFHSVPYTYMVDHAKTLGIPSEKAAWFNSIIGASNTVGQILFGYMSDCEHISSPYMYAVLTIFCGVSVLVMPWINSFLSISLFCAWFGLTVSGSFTLDTVILAEMLSMSRLTNAYGLLMLGQGIGDLLGDPLTGLLSDKTGNYYLTFLATGIGLIVAGLIMFFPLLMSDCRLCVSKLNEKHRQNRKRSKNKVHLSGK